MITLSFWFHNKVTIIISKKNKKYLKKLTLYDIMIKLQCLFNMKTDKSVLKLANFSKDASELLELVIM